MPLAILSPSSSPFPLCASSLIYYYEYLFAIGPLLSSLFLVFFFPFPSALLRCICVVHFSLLYSPPSKFTPSPLER